MGTFRAQPARLPIRLTCPLPQQLVLPFWRGEEPAEDLPRRPVPDDEAVCVLPHQVWPQLSPTEQGTAQVALLQVLQEVLDDPARSH
jgi:hypothetical protein